MLVDGLTDVYNKVHMGVCAEKCAAEYQFSREDQDNFAIQSYKKKCRSLGSRKIQRRNSSCRNSSKKGEPIIFAEDEEYKSVNFDRIGTLPTVFKKKMVQLPLLMLLTLNDGASALVLMSKEKMEELGLKPLAKIVSYADAAHEPEWFTTAPAKALPIAVKKANLDISDIDFLNLMKLFLW